MKRVYNFSPGPAALPRSVLERAAAEMTDYQGSGMSVMEMSHRSPHFKKIIENAEYLFRELLAIPNHYRVLFLQGGASTQFAMVPLNLFRAHKRAGYIDTGAWSVKAAKEAARYGAVDIVASSRDRQYAYIPDMTKIKIEPDVDYAHITTNNTIYGTRYRDLPECGAVPLVADMSSHLLSERLDIQRFGLIYAGAQKNMGPAGVTVVIIRDDLIGDAHPLTPTMLRYQTAVNSRSLYNTPPCYVIYMVGLVLTWLLENGGIEAAERRNKEKAGLLYAYLDQSRLFSAMVEEPHRSLMNIPFVLPDEALTTRFLSEAEAAGLVNLKGYRSVGGMRASLYNAFPFEGVQALVRFMAAFEERYASD